MSSQPAMSMSSATLPAAARVGERGKVSISGLTLTGVLLFVIGLLVVASGYTSLRPEVMGLRLHPCLVPMAMALPLVLLVRLGDFPVRLLAALLVFTAMYYFSLLNGGSMPLSDVFKLGAAVVTIVVCALLVRRRGDFVAGALGLSLAIAILAARGLQDGAAHGVEVMEGANKNSYSLFALPAILMAGYIGIHMKSVPVFVKGLLVACTLPALAAIFMSANRSGYLGAVLIGLMLFRDRRGKGMLLVGAIAVAILFWMMNYGNTAVFDERMKQTIEGNTSDEHRKGILWTCTRLAASNPIIGVSPQNLGFEIARNMQIGHGRHLNSLAAHNIYAHVAAGSGLICFAALLAIGYTLYALKPANGRKFGGRHDPARQARNLMRMMVILWAVRGLFTHEILYNPACNIALGLCIGLFIVSQNARPEVDGDSAKQSPAPPPTNRFPGSVVA